MKLYHSTFDECAASILKTGFKDGSGLPGVPASIGECGFPTNHSHMEMGRLFGSKYRISFKSSMK